MAEGRRAGAAGGPALDFLVIGAQKAGTSFLHAGLADHPGIAMPAGEVPYFEDPDYGREDEGYLGRLFAAAPEGALRGIKRPNYLGKAECAVRIARAVPDARLVCVLRHPVRRAVSAYYHQMRNGVIPVAPPDEGLTAVLDGEYRELHPRSREILDFGLYGRHLRRYLSHFDRSQLRVLPFRTLLERPAAVIRDLYGWLGADPSHVPSTLDRRPKGAVYSLAAIRILRAFNPLAFRYDEDRTRFHPREDPVGKVARKARSAAWSAMRRTGLPGGEAPRLSPAVRERLTDYYREDVRLLDELLGESYGERWLGGASEEEGPARAEPPRAGGGERGPA